VFATQQEPAGITGPVTNSQPHILTPEAIQFLVKLSTTFESRRRQLLDARRARQLEIDNGVQPDFPAETAEIRGSQWKVAPAPADLMDRRVEITGPTDRKMIINARNSGARVFMADFEDSNSPTWENILEGQVNLCDAVNGTITYTSPEGKRYAVCETPATLMVRPRGWHLVEKHFLVNGEPISASLSISASFSFTMPAA
jgi:malate synthase